MYLFCRRGGKRPWRAGYRHSGHACHASFGGDDGAEPATVGRKAETAGSMFERLFTFAPMSLLLGSVITTLGVGWAHALPSCTAASLRCVIMDLCP